MTVPMRQDWPNLRLPFDTLDAWDEDMEDGKLPHPATEDDAIAWCRDNGHAYVWAGGKTAEVPGTFLPVILAHGMRADH
jgi:hypothetical protein